MPPSKLEEQAKRAVPSEQARTIREISRRPLGWSSSNLYRLQGGNGKTFTGMIESDGISICMNFVKPLPEQHQVTHFQALKIAQEQDLFMSMDPGLNGVMAIALLCITRTAPAA